MSIIWLPKKGYEKYQESSVSPFSTKPINYVVTSIKKTLMFEQEVKSVSFKYVSDTSAILYINDVLVSNANVKTHGDFIFEERPTTEFYWTEKEVEVNSKEINLLAYVQLSPTKFLDFSSGFGGFILKGVATLKDGTKVEFETDKTWDIRLENRYYSPRCYDAKKELGEYVKAEEKDYKWTIYESNIPLPIEEEISFDNKFIIEANKKAHFIRDLPIIYSSYIELEVKCLGEVDIHIDTYENKNKTGELETLFVNNDRIRIFDMYSVGKLDIKVKNKSSSNAEVIVHLYHSHTPTPKLGSIITNNERLNDLFKKCQFATVNCSQTLLLDSPMHLEPAASCSGDYTIISLVLGFSTGNYDLIKHALRVYFRLLLNNHGRNANGDYALIPFRWLWHFYMITGDKQLLKDCLPGLKATLEEFATYVGDNGIIEKSYNYVFMDWLVVDGYNLFCPPKNLGQSVYSMFYYDALVHASKIFDALEDEKNAKKTSNKAKRLKKAINELLFDKERGLYIEGLNTPLQNGFRKVYRGTAVPPGVEGKIYYRKHANVLATAYGLANKKTSKQILSKIFGELKDLEIQPYFQHYLFEAIHRNGLDNKYAMKVVKEWTRHVKVKDKGLPEGFYKPTPTYIFDFSHAWACSPYYSFIVAASGLEILEPGMRKIRLNMSNLRLKDVTYSIGTPFGFIKINNCKVIEKPIEIEIVE